MILSRIVARCRPTRRVRMHSVEIKIGLEWNLGIHLFLLIQQGKGVGRGRGTFGQNYIYTYVRVFVGKRKGKRCALARRCFIIDMQVPARQRRTNRDISNIIQ